MKKKLTIFISFCLLIIASCGPGKELSFDYSDEFDVQYARELIVTQTQLDSVCTADTLTQHFKNWYSSAFVDYETNKAKTKYMYFKNTINKRITYILSPYKDDKFKLVIRTEINED